MGRTRIALSGIYDIFTLRIHMYNIINGTVRIKIRIPNSIILRLIEWYGIVLWGRVEEGIRRYQEDEVYGCVIAWY